MTTAIIIAIFLLTGAAAVFYAVMWRQLEYGFNRMDRLEREMTKLWKLQTDNITVSDLQAAARPVGPAGEEAGK